MIIILKTQGSLGLPLPYALQSSDEGTGINRLVICNQGEQYYRYSTPDGLLYSQVIQQTHLSRGTGSSECMCFCIGPLCELNPQPWC